jgi:hypothetical protein
MRRHQKFPPILSFKILIQKSIYILLGDDMAAASAGVLLGDDMAAASAAARLD